MFLYARDFPLLLDPENRDTKETDALRVLLHGANNSLDPCGIQCKTEPSVSLVLLFILADKLMINDLKDLRKRRLKKMAQPHRYFSPEETELKQMEALTRYIYSREEQIMKPLAAIVVYSFRG